MPDKNGFDKKYLNGIVLIIVFFISIAAIVRIPYLLPETGNIPYIPGSLHTDFLIAAIVAFLLMIPLGFLARGSLARASLALHQISRLSFLRKKALRSYGYTDLVDEKLPVIFFVRRSIITGFLSLTITLFIINIAPQGSLYIASDTTGPNLPMIYVLMLVLSPLSFLIVLGLFTLDDCGVISFHSAEKVQNKRILPDTEGVGTMFMRYLKGFILAGAVVTIYMTTILQFVNRAFPTGHIAGIVVFLTCLPMIFSGVYCGAFLLLERSIPEYRQKFVKKLNLKHVRSIVEEIE